GPEGRRVEVRGLPQAIRQRRLDRRPGPGGRQVQGQLRLEAVELRIDRRIAAIFRRALSIDDPEGPRDLTGRVVIRRYIDGHLAEPVEKEPRPGGVERGAFQLLDRGFGPSDHLASGRYKVLPVAERLPHEVLAERREDVVELGTPARGPAGV